MKPSLTFTVVRLEDKHDEAGHHGIDRNRYEDLFLETLDAMGLDNHGCVYDEYLKPFETTLTDPETNERTHAIDTPLFRLVPFTEMLDLTMPNFTYKPYHLDIWWYKYALREAYGNAHVTEDEWRKMCDELRSWAKHAREGTEPHEVAEHDLRSEADRVAEQMAARLRAAWRENDELEERNEELEQRIQELEEHIRELEDTAKN